MTEQPPQRPAPQEAPLVAPQAAGGAVRRGRFGIWMLLSLPLVVLLVVFFALAITHRALALPDWVVTRIETRANAGFGAGASVHLAGGADLIVDEGIRPRVRFHDVTVLRPDGREIARFPTLRATMFVEPLLRGQILLRSFRVSGAEIALNRLPDGRLDLDLGDEDVDLPLPATAAEAMAQLKAAFASPALARLEQIEAEDLNIRLTDFRLNRIWAVQNGNFRLRNDDAQLSASLGFGIGDAHEDPAEVALSVSTVKNGQAAQFSATVRGVNSRDLAVQSPALALLQVIDAPISGWMRSGVAEDGTLLPVDAALELAAGQIRPAPEVKPIPIQRGKMYLNYQAGAGRLEMSELSIDSRAMRLRASGQALIRDLKNGLPQTILGQVAIRDLQLDPEGIFESPARFSGGGADLRISLAPFAIDIGQVQLISENSRLSAKGHAEVVEKGWKLRLDTAIDTIASDRLLALWPAQVVPKTRDWVAENVSTGELQNVHAALRLTPATEPVLALNYEFRGAEVRILRTLPNVQQGRGFASIVDFRHGLMVEEGNVTAPSGGQVEVADTVLVVPDVRIKPAPAVVRLHTRSPIPAALSLLDQPPFQFMTKAGRPTDIAEGWADAQTELSLTLKKDVPAEEVGFKVRAALSDVSSDKVVAGRVLTADRLDLRADRQGISIAGKGQLDGVAFEAGWNQKFGPEFKGKSTVDGRIMLSPETMARFGIGLPKGLFSGAGWGDLHLEMNGSQTRYNLRSKLAGIGLSIPEIGWSLAKGAQGNLAISGQFGSPGTVDNLRLDAAGLTAEGALDLAAGGGMKRARFKALKIGNWFDGSADLIGKGAATPDVVVTGGRFDLRRLPDRVANGGGTGGNTKITANLDRLQISDTIALTGLRADLTTRGGMRGTFSGKVNGDTGVTGTVLPAQSGRTAVTVLSDSGGGVLRAAGIFGRARGGKMVLTLTPIGRESYDGALKITNLRVKDAPVLASLLSLASVVGLLEQLGGEGILFAELDSRFRLTPNGVSVTRGEAFGTSMGVTMQGNYYPDTGKLEMRGVVSPFYILNGIGQVLTRRGEGLFGVNYTLKGTDQKPVVSVNPFSILTPGMFREIFRRDPPAVLKE